MNSQLSQTHSHISVSPLPARLEPQRHRPTGWPTPSNSQALSCQSTPSTHANSTHLSSRLSDPPSSSSFTSTLFLGSWVGCWGRGLCLLCGSLWIAYLGFFFFFFLDWLLVFWLSLRLLWWWLWFGCAVGFIFVVVGWFSWVVVSWFWWLWWWRSWLWVMVVVWAVWSGGGSGGMYYFIVVNILFYCDIYIILLCWKLK